MHAPARTSRAHSHHSLHSEPPIPAGRTPWRAARREASRNPKAETKHLQSAFANVPPRATLRVLPARPAAPARGIFVVGATARATRPSRRRLLGRAPGQAEAGGPARVRARGEDSSLGRGAAAMRSGACASGGSMRALLCSRCAPERLAATPQRQPSASLGAAPRLASSPYRSLPSSISFLESGLQRMTTRTVSVGAIARARGAPRTVTTYM